MMVIFSILACSFSHWMIVSLVGHMRHSGMGTWIFTELTLAALLSFVLHTKISVSNVDEWKIEDLMTPNSQDQYDLEPLLLEE